MTTRLQFIVATATSALLLLGTTILFGALLFNHYQLITFAVPLDYNEGGMLSVTATLAKGDNPYAFENQPESAVVYPVLYNLIVTPLSEVFGNTLPLHRAVAGLFILLSCGLCYLIVRRQGNSKLEGVAAATLWYAALLYYSTPIASPNSLGVFLFFASISIPYLFDFSNRSLGVAVVVGVLAFYGKQYLVACLGYIALYIFISISKKTALLFGTAALILFVALLALVSITSPYFLDNTIFAVNHVAGLVSNYETAFKQLLAFTQIYLPLLLILILQTARTLLGTRTVQSGAAHGTRAHHDVGFMNFSNLNAPMLNVRIDYIWFCFTCSLIVIVFIIGKNPANHLTYLFQIMSPFFLIACFRIIADSGRFKPLFHLLVIATFYLSYSVLSHDFSTNSKNWEKMKQIMSGADSIFASTVVLSEVVGTGKEVYDNGHTRYFYHAEERPPIFSHGGPDQGITKMWTRYVNEIYSMIEGQKFDLILIDQWMQLPKPSPRSRITSDAQGLLQMHYYRSDTIRLNLAKRPGGGAYDIQVWKPKENADGGPSQD